MLKLARWILLPALLAAVTGVAIADSYTFTIIAPNGAETFLNGINDQGQIVGNYYPFYNAVSILYSGGTYSTIATPYASDETQVSAQGVNNLGQIVGYYEGGHILVSTAYVDPRTFSVRRSAQLGSTGDKRTTRLRSGYFVTLKKLARVN